MCLQAARGNDLKLRFDRRAWTCRLYQQKLWMEASRWVIRGSRLLDERPGRTRAAASTSKVIGVRAKAAPRYGDCQATGKCCS